MIWVGVRIPLQEGQIKIPSGSSCVPDAVFVDQSHFILFGLNWALAFVDDDPVL